MWRKRSLTLSEQFYIEIFCLCSAQSPGCVQPLLTSAVAPISWVKEPRCTQLYMLLAFIYFPRWSWQVKLLLNSIFKWFCLFYFWRRTHLWACERKTQIAMIQAKTKGRSKDLRFSWRFCFEAVHQTTKWIKVLVRFDSLIFFMSNNFCWTELGCYKEIKPFGQGGTIRGHLHTPFLFWFWKQQ